VPEGFDLAVIGGGPGGYVAAIRAAQLGARVAVVEKDRLGGTCLVRGCIPTKALLQSSELYSTISRQGLKFGVVTQGLSFDLPAAQKRRIEVVDGIVQGVEGLLKGNGVQVLSGSGRLRAAGAFSVGETEYSAGAVIIATGSVPAALPVPGAELTIDSDGILGLERIPSTMVVVGGGVVGMEWGALYAALGTQVTVIEMMPRILPMVEADMVRLYQRHFESLGGVIHTEARVESIHRAGAELKVRFTLGGEAQEATAEVVLRATGRVPYTEDLGLDATGVATERGRVVVDDHLQTNVKGVYAVGDVIGGIMLAHVASYEGVLVADNLAGKADRTPDYRAVPNCIYTDPEIANVGLGEAEARERGLEVKVGRFPFAASGRAMTLGSSEGAIKIIADAKDDTVLGVQMVGPRVTDLIAEATIAVQQRLSLKDIELTIHAHPTLSESFLEAALAANGAAIHVLNRQRAAAKPTPAPPTPTAVAPAARPPAPAAAIKTAARQPRTSAQLSPPAAGPAIPGLNLDRLDLKRTNKDELLKIYRLMFLIRRFEERAQLEYTHAKIGGYCHLNLGEEATVVGAIMALKPNDWIYTSYREHGHAIARGVDPAAVMAELFGRETGTSHGRGGSMHIFDSDRHFMGGYGIVGGHLPLAVGAAFAAKYEGREDVVLCMFGDGASNIGAFHESLNMSKVMHLPVVWFCVNNQYGMGTPVEKASAVPHIYLRAAAYDIEAIQVDGMDVIEVARRTAEIVRLSRKDGEPRFIEALNYRFRGHSVVDPDKYRDEAEKAKWRESDPVVSFEHRLTQARAASKEEIQSIQDSVQVQIDEAVAFSDASPNPPVDDLYQHLYSPDWELER